MNRNVLLTLLIAYEALFQQSEAFSTQRLKSRRSISSSRLPSIDPFSLDHYEATPPGLLDDTFLDFTSTKPEDVLPKDKDLVNLSHQEPSTAAETSKVPSYKKLLAFAGTTILIWLSEPCLSLVDTAVVGLTQGATSVVQLAAMGPATTVVDSLLYMTYFLALATTNLVSEGLAIKDYKKLQKHTSHVLGVAAVMGCLVTGIIFAFGKPMLTGMAGASATPELVNYALKYTYIRALVAPLSVMGMVAQSHALASMDTIRPIVAVAAASIINVVGDLWLSPFGVAGAAVATACASTISSVILLQGVWKRMKEWRRKEVEEESASMCTTITFANGTTLDRPIDASSVIATSETISEPSRKTPFMSMPDKKSFFNLVNLSGPLMFNMWAKIAAYSVLTIRATDFGVVSMAAHNVLMRIFFFFGCFADSLGATAQAFLPATLYPQKDTASFNKILKRLSYLAVGIALVNSQIATWLVNNMGGHLTKDASILAAMKSNSHLMGLSLLLHPLIVTMEGTVIATRNFTKLIQTYVTSLGVHGALLFGVCSSFSGVWATLVGFQIARVMGYAVRRRRPQLQ